MQETDGNDSELMPLRDLLIKLEGRSIVDFQLAGHECQRPSPVTQGQEEAARQGWEHSQKITMVPQFTKTSSN